MSVVLPRSVGMPSACSSASFAWSDSMTLTSTPISAARRTHGAVVREAAKEHAFAAHERHRVPNQLIDPARFALKFVCEVEHG